MNPVRTLLASSLFLFLNLSGCGKSSTTAPTDGFKDPRDGTIYDVVKIGSQTWFVENLDYKGTGKDTVGVCQENAQVNCDAYGRLYNWAEVMNLAAVYNSTTFGGTRPAQGICPIGSHVPSDSEWTKLDSAVHGKANNMKSAILWDGNNSSGFDAFPGGSQYLGTTFNTMGTDAYFWTSTESGSGGGYYWYFYTSNPTAYHTAFTKASRLSVRCLVN